MTIHSHKETESKKTTGWFAFRWIAGLFLVMFIANGIFLTFALKTHRGVQEDNAYEKGRNYNDQLAMNRLKSELGWNLNLTIENQDFLLSIVNRESEIVRPDGLSALLFRPTNAEADIQLSVVALDDGRFRLISDQEFHGLWDLKLAIDWGGQVLHYNERIVTR